MTDVLRAEEWRDQEGTILSTADLTVVICSLNGEAGVHRCLDALSRQTINSRLEVIVVDDGSTDGTSDVARAVGAIVIRHLVNRGLAAARNSGLRAASAPIVAFLDDDCEPEPEWAEQLIAGYSEGVMGVGGLILPQAPDGFLSGYLKRHNPLKPLELSLAKSNKLGYRFYLYLKRQLAAEEAHCQRDVYMLVGANMSFRKQAVIDAGLFDERFRFGGEEGDLCRTLAHVFPSSRLLFTPQARVVHHFEPSLRDTLRRSHSYGVGCARFYRKWPNERSKFFPWPVLVLALLLSSAAFPLLAFAAVAAPQVLYPRSVRMALSQRRVGCLLDPYLELAQETCGNIGFLRGLWLFRDFVPQSPSEPKEPSVPAVTVRRQALPWPAEQLVSRDLSEQQKWPDFPVGVRTLLVFLALLVLLVPFHGSWVVQFLLVLFLLTVPGVILLRALRIPGNVIASFPIYVPCASLVVLLGSGLAVDLIGPFAGVAVPLRPWPMVVGLELVCLILLAVSINAPPSVVIPWRNLPRPGRTALPLLLPLVAAAGALRLNSGHGNGVALAALCACVLVTIAVIIYAAKLHISLVAVILYAVGLAMLWSYSLRGSSVYGFDISAEYFVFHHTVHSGVWDPAAQPDNAYAAMLSTTVLPAELHAVAGVPELLVLKLVYPVISALFPVAVFFLAQRILSCRWAFAAGALIITQSGFSQELPAIARQEISLVLFVGLMAAMLETKLPRRLQWPLVLSFAFAMVVSHYTTTYVTITWLGLALFFQWVTSWFRSVPRVSGGMAVAFLAATIGAVIWYGPVTHSSSNVTKLAESTRSQGLSLFPNNAHAKGLLAAYLDGNTGSPMSAGQYARLVRNEYAKSKPYVHPLPDADNPVYELRDLSIPSPPVKWTLGYNAFNLGAILAQQLIYPLGAVGALILVFRRRGPVVARQIGLLTVATLVFLLAVRFSGTLATFYNAERALLQGMVFLDIALFWCMQELAGRRKLLRAGAVTAGAALVAVIFITSSGLVGAALGGGTRTNLANSGADYERFYVTAQELASATWLATRYRPGQLVYADNYGQLPLVSISGLGSHLLLDVTPDTLNNHAWIYVSRTNTIDGQANASFGDNSVSYVFPSTFLNANYNLVYTNGSSKVYQR